MSWNALWTSELSESTRRRIADLVLSVYRDAFGDEFGWSQEGVLTRLSQSNLVLLLNETSEHCDGYAFCHVPAQPFHGRQLIWTNNRAVRRVWSNRGYGRESMRVAIDRVTRDLGEVGWLAGRTQNPSIIRLYASFMRDGHSEPVVLFPFTAKFTAAPYGIALRSYLEAVPQLKGAGIGSDGVYGAPVMAEDTAKTLGVDWHTLEATDASLYHAFLRWEQESTYRHDPRNAIVICGEICLASSSSRS